MPRRARVLRRVSRAARKSMPPNVMFAALLAIAFVLALALAFPFADPGRGSGSRGVARREISDRPVAREGVAEVAVDRHTAAGAIVGVWSSERMADLVTHQGFASRNLRPGVVAFVVAF